MVTRRKPPRIVVSPTEHEAVKARLDVAEARAAALARSLRAVLATIPQEFAKPEAQAIRMAARALLEEM